MQFHRIHCRELLKIACYLDYWYWKEGVVYVRFVKSFPKHQGSGTFYFQYFKIVQTRNILTGSQFLCYSSLQFFLFNKLLESFQCADSHSVPASIRTQDSRLDGGYVSICSWDKYRLFRGSRQPPLRGTHFLRRVRSFPARNDLTK